MSEQTSDATLVSAGAAEKLTGLSTAKALQSIPTAARVALIQALSQDVRWTDDGSTTPTASVGIQLAAGKDMLYTGPLADLKFIEEAASAIVEASYYK